MRLNLALCVQLIWPKCQITRFNSNTEYEFILCKNDTKQNRHAIRRYSNFIAYWQSLLSSYICVSLCNFIWFIPQMDIWILKTYWIYPTEARLVKFVNLIIPYHQSYVCSVSIGDNLDKILISIAIRDIINIELSEYLNRGCLLVIDHHTKVRTELKVETNFRQPF